MYDFAKEMKFDEKPPGNKSTRKRSLTRLPKSPAIMASGISTKFLPENTNELCDRRNLLLHEKQAGKTPDKINGENIAIVDISLEHKCKSTKQPETLLLKCSNPVKYMKIIETF